MPQLKRPRTNANSEQESQTKIHKQVKFDFTESRNEVPATKSKNKEINDKANLNKSYKKLTKPFDLTAQTDYENLPSLFSIKESHYQAEEETVLKIVIESAKKEQNQYKEFKERLTDANVLLDQIANKKKWLQDELDELDTIEKATIDAKKIVMEKINSTIQKFYEMKRYKSGRLLRRPLRVKLEKELYELNLS